MKRSVYIISGPAGAGKSTTSRIIAERLSRSAHIEGDDIDHMVIGGHEKPWLSQYHTDLIWANILSLTTNFIKHNHDVVIDYVAFYHHAEFIKRNLESHQVTIKFIVLLVREDELLIRDAQRVPEKQMGHRCVDGLHEILQSRLPDKHIIDATNLDIETVVNEIMNNPKFTLE